MTSRCGYVLTEPAIDDLERLQVYLIETSGHSAYERVTRDLRRAFVLLVEHPYLGHVRPNDAPESVRFWEVHHHLIVYLPMSDPLLILRVVHGARDFTALLEDLKPFD